jgi:hypothetical protein
MCKIYKKFKIFVSGIFLSAVLFNQFAPRIFIVTHCRGLNLKQLHRLIHSCSKKNVVFRSIPRTGSSDTIKLDVPYVFYDTASVVINQEFLRKLTIFASKYISRPVKYTPVLAWPRVLRGK